MSSKLSAALRQATWNEYIGAKVGEGVCWCCALAPILVSNFECGHVTSRKNGGLDRLDNLRPVCGLCNKSMGTKSMIEFAVESGFACRLAKDGGNSTVTGEETLYPRLDGRGPLHSFRPAIHPSAPPPPGDQHEGASPRAFLLPGELADQVEGVPSQAPPAEERKRAPRTKKKEAKAATEAKKEAKKVPCKSCGKEFSPATLKKYGGEICHACVRKRNAEAEPKLAHLQKARSDLHHCELLAKVQKDLKCSRCHVFPKSEKLFECAEHQFQLCSYCVLNSGKNPVSSIVLRRLRSDQLWDLFDVLHGLDHVVRALEGSSLQVGDLPKEKLLSLCADRGLTCEKNSPELKRQLQAYVDAVIATALA